MLAKRRYVAEVAKTKAEWSNPLIAQAEKCEAGLKLTACDKQDVNKIVDDRRCAETKCRHGQIFDLTGGNSTPRVPNLHEIKISASGDVGRNKVKFRNASYGGVEEFLEKEILECRPNK